MMKVARTALRAVPALLACLLAAAPAQAADPIKVGMSLALTGGGAPAGKMLQAAIELWRDDVNAKGGLLGRPVEVIVYDDQSNPAGVPGLYTKLITVDKVDLLLGPYGTNFVAPGHADDHQEQEDGHQLHRHRHQPTNTTIRNTSRWFRSDRRA